MAVEIEARGETLRIGAAKGLFETTVLNRPITYDATPDGQRFLVMSPDVAEEPRSLTLVVNWPAELEKE